MSVQRYKVHLVALTPDKALICKQADDALDDKKGIWIPAKRVVYFEGNKWTHVDLTASEARTLGL